MAVVRRSQKTDFIVVASAVGLAVAAAFAAQMGVPQAQPLVGAIVILGIAYACSTDRRAIDVRTVVWGLSLQIIFALIVLKTTAGQRVWTFRLANTGPGAANNAQIAGVVLTQTAGTPCSPAASILTAFPITIGTIAPSANATGTVTINFAGCADTTGRFSAKVNFTANGGGYSGSTTVNNQTK